MAVQLGELQSAVNVMAKAAAELRRIGGGVTEYDPEEEYHETERRQLCKQSLELAEMYEKQIGATQTIVDDVLWQDDRDTHSIYATVLQLQPYVRKDDAQRLKDVCELLGDIKTESAALAARDREDRRRTI